MSFRLVPKSVTLNGIMALILHFSPNFHVRYRHKTIIRPISVSKSTFYSAHNARIASAALATAIPSVRPSVTRQYCVKTTTCSMVQFAPLDSKMCLVL